jgi:hypothetical protein
LSESSGSPDRETRAATDAARTFFPRASSQVDVEQKGRPGSRSGALSAPVTPVLLIEGRTAGRDGIGCLATAIAGDFWVGGHCRPNNRRL